MTDPDWTDDYDDDNPAVVLWKDLRRKGVQVRKETVDRFREAADYCAEEVEE